VASTTHQAQVPAIVAAYFGAEAVREQHPIVAGEFQAEPLTILTDRGPRTIRQGWHRQTYRKRISVAWARKLKRDGVTRVALRCGGRLADFGLDEIVRGGVW
jgi:hypothetical protein